MIFAGVARVRSLLAARLDMSILAVPSLKSVCRLYAGTGGFVTAMLAIRLMPAGYRGHKKASRTPRLAARACCWGNRTRVKLWCRHQDGVDHVDHAIRLVDVRDRDRRSAALGIDDRHRAARLLDGQLFAFNGLELLAVGQAGGLQPARNHVIGQ